AKVTLIFFMIGYGLTQLGVIKTDLHFLHILAILFVVSVVFMYITGKLWPAQNRYDDGKDLKVVDTTPWNMSVVASIAIVLCVFGVYVLFSSMGIAA
ncbi:MAG: solute:sodium symporter family transporter, partial [Elusimicrobiaceae bacterium]|nr:solute:sodium symporter family transporter [Elusimicrobiaceae bacterium]